MKYAEMYNPCVHAKGDKAAITGLPLLDRQAFGCIQSLSNFRRFRTWWSELNDRERDDAFAGIKRVLKKG